MWTLIGATLETQGDDVTEGPIKSSLAASLSVSSTHIDNVEITTKPEAAVSGRRLATTDVTDAQNSASKYTRPQAQK